MTTSSFRRPIISYEMSVPYRRDPMWVVSEDQRRILETLEREGWESVEFPMTLGGDPTAPRPRCRVGYGGAWTRVGDDVVFVAVNSGDDGANEIVTIPARTFDRDPGGAWTRAYGETSFA